MSRNHIKNNGKQVPGNPSFQQICPTDFPMEKQENRSSIRNSVVKSVGKIRWNDGCVIVFQEPGTPSISQSGKLTVWTPCPSISQSIIFPCQSGLKSSLSSAQGQRCYPRAARMASRMSASLVSSAGVRPGPSELSGVSPWIHRVRGHGGLLGPYIYIYI